MRPRVVGLVKVIKHLPPQNRGNALQIHHLIRQRQTDNLVRHGNGTKNSEGRFFDFLIQQDRISYAKNAAQFGHPVPVIVNPDIFIL